MDVYNSHGQGWIDAFGIPIEIGDHVMVLINTKTWKDVGIGIVKGFTPQSVQFDTPEYAKGINALSYGKRPKTYSGQALYLYRNGRSKKGEFSKYNKDSHSFIVMAKKSGEIYHTKYGEFLAANNITF